MLYFRQSRGKSTRIILVFTYAGANLYSQSANAKAPKRKRHVEIERIEKALKDL